MKRVIAIAALIVSIATSALGYSKYDSVGYGVYVVRTKNVDGEVRVRSGPSKDAWVMNYAKNGTRFIAIKNVDGWVLVIEPKMYEIGREPCEWIWVDYLVDEE